MSVVFVVPHWRVLEEDDKFIPQWYKNDLEAPMYVNFAYAGDFETLSEAIEYLSFQLHLISLNHLQ